MIRKIPLTYILIGVIVTLLGSLSLSVHLYKKMKADRDRLENNQNILLHNGNVEITQTSHGQKPSVCANRKPTYIGIPPQWRHFGKGSKAGGYKDRAHLAGFLCRHSTRCRHRCSHHQATHCTFPPRHHNEISPRYA